jgi:hypothetical protein
MNTKVQVLDIAMNLNRVGNWAADDYIGKKDRIRIFLAGTSNYIRELKRSSLPNSFLETYSKFVIQYNLLQKEGLSGPKDPTAWAEKMMTWGNILTHRSSLIT